MALQYHPLPLDVFPEAARPHIQRHNVELRNLFALEGCLREEREGQRSDRSIVRGEAFQVHTSRITPGIDQVVSGQSTVVGTPALTFSTVNTVGSTTTAVSINSTIALFDTTAPAALATSASTGSAGFAARRDHVHIFPPTLQTTANLATGELTDNGTGMTWTTSLGTLSLRPQGELLDLPKWTGAFGGGNAGTILRFSGSASDFGSAMVNGIEATLNFNAGNTYTGNLLNTSLTMSHNTSPTFTSVTMRPLTLSFGTEQVMTGTHSFTERTAIRMVMRGVRGTTVTVTDSFGIFADTWPLLNISAGTYTNAAMTKMQMPTIGSTIRRGHWLTTTTGNVGTAPTNAEGFYCEDITQGTSRTSYYGDGATNGTPTNVVTFYGASHTVGTNRWSLWGSNKVHCDTSDFIAEASGKGIIVKASDDATRYLRIRALYSGGAPTLTIDDVGTAAPTS